MEDKCKIIRDITKVEFEVKRDNFFRATRVCFKEKPKRWEMEKINTCFKKNKMKTIWGEKCVLIKT
jgi:hypothetical protein